jgi:hypothetical protein
MKQMTGFQYLLSILLLIVLFASCAAPVYVKPEPIVVEKERVIHKSFDTTWQNAVEWFATHNMPIKNLDKNSGLISTEYSLSMAEAAQYMNCGSGESNFSGKVELDNHTGNFNVLLKKIGDHSTKVIINAFFGCTVKHYRYESLISTEYVLESTARTTCTSTGQLEKEVLEYLSGQSPAVEQNNKQ